MKKIASKSAKSATSSKNAAEAPKKVAAKSKERDTPSKKRAAPSKERGEASKERGSEPKKRGADAKLTAQQLAEREAATQKDPPYKRVALTPAPRTNREVENLELAVTGARTRLRLAFKYSDAVYVALPDGFHDLAWSALEVVEGESSDAPSAAPVLKHSPVTTLFDLLSTGRNVVELTTRPGDQARAALGFGTPLVRSRTLPKQAAPWVRALPSLRGRFPALTAEHIAQTEAALEEATAYVKRARSADASDKGEQVDAADGWQLGVDVLTHCIDHLRAAARSVLWTTRPKLAEYLFSPLEGTRGRRGKASSEEEPEPEPTPTK